MNINGMIFHLQRKFCKPSRTLQCGWLYLITDIKYPVEMVDKYELLSIRQLGLIEETESLNYSLKWFYIYAFVYDKFEQI